MRKLSREQVRPFIWYFAGGIFVLISFITGFKVILSTGQAVSILTLLIIGAVCFFLGIRDKRRLELTR